MMRLLMRRHREVSIFFSCIILTLSFVIASDTAFRRIGVPALFGMGALMYGFGAVREGRAGHGPLCVLETALALAMLVPMLFSILGMGGGV